MSWQARIIKRLLKFYFNTRSGETFEAQRLRQENSARFSRLPSGVHCQPVDANGIQAAWIEAGNAKAGAILYLHGGGYALGSINTHREWIARLAAATDLRCLAINYRLAPEHPYPAALEDAVKAYQWLLEQGFSSAQTIIAGDSAGGGLTLAMMLVLRDAGYPTPAGAVCISPWTDLAHTGASIQEKSGVDPILSLESSERFAGYYAGDHARTEPLISPHYADLTGLPPLLIQVGSDEILLDDAVRCADHAKQAGVEVILEIWAEMFHVFQIVPILPETKRALEHITKFAAERVRMPR